jgi:hypothetical protein
MFSLQFSHLSNEALPQNHAQSLRAEEAKNTELVQWRATRDARSSMQDTGQWQ